MTFLSKKDFKVPFHKIKWKCNVLGLQVINLQHTLWASHVLGQLKVDILRFVSGVDTEPFAPLHPQLMLQETVPDGDFMLAQW